MAKNSRYDVYDDMMKSCYDEKNFMYHRIGAKGIQVCQEWHDKDTFYRWLDDNGWKVGLKIVRRDKDKDYCPENCYLTLQQNRKVEKIVPKDLVYATIGDKISNHPIYKIYCTMKQRCYNPNYPEYPLYGERGIKISNEWLGKYGAIKFIIWSLENGWEDGLTIDRMNNDLGYSPDNCRWTDDAEQSHNRRNVTFYEYNGKSLTLNQIAKELNLDSSKLYKLVNKENIDLYDAIDIIMKPKEPKPIKIYPKNPDENIYFSDGKVNYSAVARKYGIPRQRLKKLVDKGMDLNDAINQVVDEQTCA